MQFQGLRKLNPNLMNLPFSPQFYAEVRNGTPVLLKRSRTKGEPLPTKTECYVAMNEKKQHVYQLRF